MWRLLAGSTAAMVVMAFASPVAKAQISMVSPGVMQVDDLPTSAQAGGTFVFRDRLPLTVHDGEMCLQQRDASRWRTVAVAAVHARSFRLLWQTPNAPGSTVTIRLWLRRSGRSLAISGARRVTVQQPYVPPPSPPTQP